jgi:diaminohydroxyphosphoribosylaminopyrimidine deaminase/5-amino-6-(5-phosphoribosylamino)uracil reductase
VTTTRATGDSDDRFMGLALGLAQRGLGRVWPNPAVGCVIVDSNGRVAGRGWTQDGGRPHAETVALRAAGPRAKGATAYVSLEPCAHRGETGPCAAALSAAGIARVVSALEDPNPLVAGKGHAMLEAAGIEVRVGVRAGEAWALNEGFFLRIEQGRPALTLKFATTLDGKIALPSGQSRWVTGERARAHAHLLRAQHDAVMVGVGTALADDPELTCRLPGLGARPAVRLVVDSKARLSPSSKLAATAREQPVWLLTTPSADTAATVSLAAKGVELVSVPASSGGIDLSAAMKVLGARGLTRVLVEGGATLAAALIAAGLVDNLAWYRASSIMGDGVGAVGAFPLADLAFMPRFTRVASRALGEDVLETYRRAP